MPVEHESWSVVDYDGDTWYIFKDLKDAVDQAQVQASAMQENVVIYKAKFTVKPDGSIEEFNHAIATD